MIGLMASGEAMEEYGHMGQRLFENYKEDGLQLESSG